MSSLNEYVLSNDIVTNAKLEIELFYLNEYNLQTDSISCAYYVCLFAFYASKLSDKIATKNNERNSSMICLRLTVI